MKTILISAWQLNISSHLALLLKNIYHYRSRVQCRPLDMHILQGNFRNILIGCRSYLITAQFKKRKRKIYKYVFGMHHNLYVRMVLFSHLKNIKFGTEFSNRWFVVDALMDDVVEATFMQSGLFGDDNSISIQLFYRLVNAKSCMFANLNCLLQFHVYYWCS